MSLATTKHRERNPWKIHHIKKACNDKKPLSITWEDLRDKFEQQGGRCYWFDIELNPDDIFGSYNPLTISADRLDNSRGYIHGNVVICCRMANLGRGRCPAYKFAAICHRLKNRWKIK